MIINLLCSSVLMEKYKSLINELTNNIIIYHECTIVNYEEDLKMYLQKKTNNDSFSDHEDYNEEIYYDDLKELTEIHYINKNIKIWNSIPEEYLNIIEDIIINKKKYRTEQIYQYNKLEDYIIKQYILNTICFKNIFININDYQEYFSYLMGTENKKYNRIKILPEEYQWEICKYICHIYNQYSYILNKITSICELFYNNIYLNKYSKYSQYREDLILIVSKFNININVYYKKYKNYIAKLAYNMKDNIINFKEYYNAIYNIKKLINNHVEQLKEYNLYEDNIIEKYTHNIIELRDELINIKNYNAVI